MTDLEQHLLEQLENQRAEIIRLTNIIFRLTGVSVETVPDNVERVPIKNDKTFTPRNWRNIRQSYEQIEAKRCQQNQQNNTDSCKEQPTEKLEV